MWNGRDSLRVEADLYLRRGASAITDGADAETGAPQPGALHRAALAEFRATSRRLAISQADWAPPMDPGLDPEK